jgi:dTDP-4-dehydrorhamnose reductase
MRVLITGVNGLLGQKLVGLLKSIEEVEVIGAGRGANRTSLAEKHYRLMDVENRQEVITVLQETKPNSVIHTAAMTQVDDCELEQEACYRANVEAVKNVVEGCELIKAHLVHLSTDFIFDGSHGPLAEEEAPNPVNYYGQAKLMAEDIVRAANLKWAIARTVLVYGVVKGLQRSNIILWVKESLEQGKKLQIVDDQWRTPTLAEDLAMGCWLLAKNHSEGIFNISGEDFLTPYDMAIEVIGFFNLDKSLVTRANSTTFAQPAKRPAKTGFIIDKARQTLGYNPHSFSEGIAIIADQIKD